MQQSPLFPPKGHIYHFFSTSNLGNVILIMKSLTLTHLFKTNTTTNIPFSEGGLIMCVGK